MIAVIIVPGPSPRMHGLDAHQSLSLLPLGDRPVLQHIIESLVSQGITTVELIVGYAPEKVEALLGNGDRWGCSFRYHLSAQSDRPYRSLKIITALRTEPWVLIHAERYPCVDFASLFNGETTLINQIILDDSQEELERRTSDTWRGTVVMPAGAVTEAFVNYTPDELHKHFLYMGSQGVAATVVTSDWIDASTPANLLRTQKRLFHDKIGSLMISGSEREPGIWISRNVVVHPSVQLVAPLYIGPNSRLNSAVKIGPNAVISGDCIIDVGTTITDALVVEGSYVGEALEVNNAVIACNLLINIQLDTGINISENFLLGGVERIQRQSGAGSLVQSLFALVVIVLLSPLFLISSLYFFIVRELSYTSVRMIIVPVKDRSASFESYSLVCLGEDAWDVPRSASWDAFTRQFLPGLFSVLSGRLNFVGLPPRTPARLQTLSEDWKLIYLKGRAGLISEASIALTGTEDDIQLYLMDAYYSARRSWWHDVKLAAMYFSRLLVPKPTATRGSAAKWVESSLGRKFLKLK